MNDTQPGLIAGALAALGHGLPALLPQFIVTVLLLVVGSVIYMAVTPFHERQQIAAGNAAAGVVMAGAIVALALPLAAMLATSGELVDIALWGVVALVIQLLTVLGASLAVRHLGQTIAAGNMAVALVLAASQIAVGLLNAAVMVPN